MAPVPGIEEFFKAVFTNWQVGGNADGRVPSLLTLPDREFFATEKRRVSHLDCRNTRRCGRLGSQVTNEGSEAFRRTLEVDFYALFSIQYPSGERVGLRQTINEWTKTHSLNYASHPNRTRTQHLQTTPRLQQSTMILARSAQIGQALREFGSATGKR